jgi:hypothetical protein
LRRYQFSRKAFGESQDRTHGITVHGILETAARVAADSMMIASTKAGGHAIVAQKMRFCITSGHFSAKQNYSKI